MSDANDPINQPFTADKAYAALQAQNAILMALATTHHDPQALAAALREQAEAAASITLNSKNSDAVIDQIVSTITAFAAVAGNSPTAQKSVG